MDFQVVAVVVIGVVVAVIIARWVWRSVSGAGSTCGSSGCAGCSKSSNCKDKRSN